MKKNCNVLAKINELDAIQRELDHLRHQQMCAKYDLVEQLVEDRAIECLTVNMSRVKKLYSS